MFRRLAASLPLLLFVLAAFFLPAAVLADNSAGTFYAAASQPADYSGISFIILAFVLFVAEIFVTSFGVLTAGGLVLLVIGLVLLFQRGILSGLDIGLIAAAAVIFIAFIFFVVNRVVKAHRRQATTGREELPGKTAVVRTTLDPEGTVFLEGELWSAVLDSGCAGPGEEVVIQKQDGLKLYVTKKPKGGG